MARRTIGSQSGVTKHHVSSVDRVDLSNTYRMIVLVMGLGLGLSLWGSMLATLSNSWATCLYTYRLLAFVSATTVKPVWSVFSVLFMHSLGNWKQR